MAKVDIAAETQALPLGYYLSGPLTAAIEAQALSAHSTIEFISELGTDPATGELRTMEFTYKKGVTDPETNETTLTDVVLTVPLLAMTEAPHMAIEELRVDFSFKIRDVISKSSQFKIAASKNTEISSNTKLKASTGGLAKFLFGSASAETTLGFKTNINVSTSFQSATRQNTEREATLKMHMIAKQRVPEGFQKVLEIFADAISSQADVPTP
jgi:hypothetical protein